MTKTKHIIHSLPVIANALGRKYGVRVFIGGDRAFTNGKDIHIPALPIDADETVLSLARGYIDHEAAHLRITDFAAITAANMSPIEHHIWNIIEDYMVEQKISALYPGCASNLAWLCRHIFANEPMDSKDRATGDTQCISNWLLYSLRSLSVPELTKGRDYLSSMLDTNFPGLRMELEPHLCTIPKVCTDTQTCIDTARKIVSALQEYVDRHTPQEQEGGQEEDIGNRGTQDNTPTGTTQDNSASGTNDVRDDSSSPVTSEENDKTSSAFQTSDEQNSEMQAETGICNADPQEEHPSTVDSAGDSPHSHTPLQQLESMLTTTEALSGVDIGAKAGSILEGLDNRYNSNALAVATPVAAQCGEFDDSKLAEIRKQTVALRSRLDGLLQARKEIRSSSGRIGRLNTGKAARLAVKDVRIFEKRTSRDGINTAVHILLDASYSMEKDKIELAARACYALALALENVRSVDVGVTTFPGSFSVDDLPSINDPTVGIVKRHGQKMHRHFKMECCGATPLAEALWWLLGEITSLKQQRRMVLILSDGIPDDQEMAQDAIEAHRLHGVEVYGIGIATSAMDTLLPGGNSRAIYNLPELPMAMFDLLHYGLFHKGGKI